MWKKILIVLFVLIVLVSISRNIFGAEFSYNNNNFIIDKDIPAFPTNYSEETYGFNGSYQKYFLVYDFSDNVFTNTQNNILYLYCLPDNDVLNSFDVYFTYSSCQLKRKQLSNGKYVSNVNFVDVLDNKLFFDKYSLDLNIENSSWELVTEMEESIYFGYDSSTNKFVNLCLYNDTGVTIDSSFYADTGELEENLFITDFITTNGYTYVAPVVVSDNSISGNTIEDISTTTNNIYDIAVMINKVITACCIFIIAFSLYKYLRKIVRK